MFARIFFVISSICLSSTAYAFSADLDDDTCEEILLIVEMAETASFALVASDGDPDIFLDFELGDLTSDLQNLVYVSTDDDIARDAVDQMLFAWHFSDAGLFLSGAERLVDRASDFFDYGC